MGSPDKILAALLFGPVNAASEGIYYDFVRGEIKYIPFVATGVSGEKTFGGKITCT